MDIAIIDDSETDKQILSDFINCYCIKKHLSINIKFYKNGENFLLNFNKDTFEIIFLDIYMNGIDGIETAEKIRQVDKECLIIFSTTSRSHAVKSFRVRAFDYLVKPYNYSQLEEVMDLCDEKLSRSSHYIEVKQGRIIVKILLNTIIFTDYSNHYIQIHLINNIIKSHITFNEFSKLLLIYPQFLCCYRNCIINMDKVISVEKRDFLMENNERVPISKFKITEVKQLYADYIFTKALNNF